MNTASPLTRALLGFVRPFLSSRPAPSIPSNPRRILVVRQHDQLGDMICVVPALRNLHDAYPGVTLDLVASPVNHGIMIANPYLDRVLLFDKREIRRSPDAASRFFRALREVSYDIAIVPSTVSVSLTSNLIARFSGAPVRVGPGALEGRENPSGFLFTHPVTLDWSADPGRHQTLRNADILRPLGIEPVAGPCVLGLTAAERAAAADTLRPLRNAHRRLVGLHAGAAKPGNRWPPEKFAATARLLHERRGCDFVITAGATDHPVLERLLPMLAMPYLPVVGRPIREVAAIIDGLDFFLSNDTGPLHIAGALSPAVLGLFGPTDPSHWAPPGRKNHFVRSKTGSISSIEVEEVLAISEVILEGLSAETRRFD